MIIADAHVGQRPGDAQAMVDLVTRLPDQGFIELIYLGDAFQYLIGMSKFWTRSVREVMASWQDVRKQGLRIVIVEGNRDFFLDEPDLLSRVDWTGRRYQFRAQAHCYRLVHGDRLNLRDLQYQFWSRLSKSLLARVWARMLPRSVAVAIVQRMEARLATTNVKFRYRTPERALRRSAACAWREHVDVLLWGHFHRFWEHVEGHRRAMVVPAWLETGRALAVEPDGAWSWVDSERALDRTVPANDCSTDPT
jgi:UDP-2,3-diacylglucosamine pyrophosphatase LpxH